jgi:hypothetical protein
VGGGRLGLGTAWLVGVIAGAVALGPGFGSGSLLNLDLVLTAKTPVPPGLWGLGPDPPRRVPFGVLFAWGSHLLGGPLAGKLILVLCVASAVAGVIRLVPAGVPALASVGAGLLYGLSPFTLTRLATGQWDVLGAAAVLPWALPSLTRPGRSLARTFTWSAALGFTGVVGGLSALMVAGVGLAADRGRRTLPIAASVLSPQLMWAIPGVFVLGLHHGLAGSASFPTRATGPLGAPTLLAGQGFWRSASQLGHSGSGAVLLGLVLGALAALGATTLPDEWRWRGLAVAAIGLGLALASAVPGVRSASADLTAMGPLAAFRETQRFFPLVLVWVMPAAACGAMRLGGGGHGRRIPTWPAVIPVIIAAALALPALADGWSVLRPVRFSSEWAAAHRAVAAAPGPVLALPWHEYLDLTAAKGRRVLNPLPDYLGGDVIASTDPEVGPPRQEGVDARIPALKPLIAQASAGEPVASALARLQVRWVAVLRDADWEAFTGLASDPGLAPAVAGNQLDLYRVRAWPGRVVAASGGAVRDRAIVAPLHDLTTSGPAVWDHAAMSGWLRGLHPVGRTADGLVRLPGGSGVVWYWPAVLVVGVDLAILVALFAVNRRRFVRGHPGSGESETLACRSPSRPLTS